MLCGMAGHASKESAEAYLRCGTDSVAQALGMMEPKFRKACIASEIFKQGLMQWLSLPAWPPCVSCSRRSLVENPLLTVARALALADELGELPARVCLPICGLSSTGSITRAHRHPR